MHVLVPTLIFFWCVGRGPKPTYGGEGGVTWPDPPVPLCMYDWEGMVSIHPQRRGPGQVITTTTLTTNLEIDPPFPVEMAICDE